ncbi:MAG: 30S ribosomal protein S20 [Anaerolineae bacterium CFX3]|nr:30S ribosomal protein S20 [Anaerolineae bacterium CFX3]MCQ3946411.1 30S ribosomal protein S20 [Anaerolineae bacterium]OQY85534.1 MAG: 30S ribosomal protein S20 [Anaerolineae bacterium UTCFX3]RIK25867.1 MAG: 30S ribosomal protein S20 [Anaerolineae bacterium]
MANIKSQIKRNKQNEKKRLRNRTYRGAARTAVKNARKTMSEAEVKTAISALDTAAERGVIHAKNAARRKSRLMKAANKAAQAGTASAK